VLVLNPEGQGARLHSDGPITAGAKEPKGLPSNVTFGIGAEKNVLYVTVDKSLYRIPLKTAGLKKPFEK